MNLRRLAAVARGLRARRYDRGYLCIEHTGRVERSDPDAIEYMIRYGAPFGHAVWPHGTWR